MSLLICSRSICSPVSRHVPQRCGWMGPVPLPPCSGAALETSAGAATGKGPLGVNDNGAAIPGALDVGVTLAAAGALGWFAASSYDAVAPGCVAGFVFGVGSDRFFLAKTRSSWTAETEAGPGQPSPAPSERRVTSSGESSALASAAGHPAGMTPVRWLLVWRWGTLRARPQGFSAVARAAQKGYQLSLVATGTLDSP